MATFNYTTNSKRILGDLFTPVSLYMRLRDLYPQSMLMESSDYDGNENAKSIDVVQQDSFMVKDVYVWGLTL